MKTIYWEGPSDDVGSNIGSEDAYPVQDDIRTGESGQGYVLRMARANFLTGLAEIRRRLGKHFSTTLTTIDAPFLSQWFGADLSKLKWAFEEVDNIDGVGLVNDNNSCFYAGHFIPRRNFLNRMAPRVCPACLAEGDHCRVTWDFSFVTACPKHECLLIDQCPGCLKAISWQRPAVDICNCGTYLNDPVLYPQDQAMELDLAVSRWICQQIEGMPTQKKGAENDEPLLQLIRPLSFHGGMSILWVLSLAEENKALTNISVIDGQMLERCRKSLLRANEFSTKLAINNLETFRSKKRQTLIPKLAECMKESYTYEDRSLAQSLISTILRASGKLAKTIGGLPVQRSLFAECPSFD